MKDALMKVPMAVFCLVCLIALAGYSPRTGPAAAGVKATTASSSPPAALSPDPTPAPTSGGTVAQSMANTINQQLAAIQQGISQAHSGLSSNEGDPTK